MTTPDGHEQSQSDPMEASGMSAEDADAYWNTVTDPDTFDTNDW